MTTNIRTNTPQHRAAVCASSMHASTFPHHGNGTHTKFTCAGAAPLKSHQRRSKSRDALCHRRANAGADWGAWHFLSRLCSSNALPADGGVSQRCSSDDPLGDLPCCKCNNDPNDELLLLSPDGVALLTGEEAYARKEERVLRRPAAATASFDVDDDRIRRAS